MRRFPTLCVCVLSRVRNAGSTLKFSVRKKSSWTALHWTSSDSDAVLFSLYVLLQEVVTVEEVEQELMSPMSPQGQEPEPLGGATS